MIRATRRPPLPHGRALALTLAVFLLFAAIVVPLGFLRDFVAWRPVGAGVWQTALIVLISPAFLEELIFRAPLLRWRDARLAAGLLAAYVAVHPLNAWAWEPALRPWFYDAEFLAVVGALGAGASWLVWRTGRLYPAVLFHWAVVVIWLHLLGGPLPARG